MASRRRVRTQAMKVESRRQVTPAVRLLVGGLLLAALVLITFAPLTTFEFVNYDDYEFVVDNRFIASGLTWDGLVWAFAHPYIAAGGPVTWLSHMLDIEIAGMAPGAHHVTNLVLHLANTIAVLLLLHRMTDSVWASALTAALFGVHPLHVESVAWVAQRKDLLSTLFWLAALWSYVSYVRRASAWGYAIVAAWTVLALLSKPTAVALPVTLLLLDIWPLNRVPLTRECVRMLGRLIVEKLPLLVLAAVTAALTFLDQQSLGAVANHVELPGRLANATVSYVAYLGKTFWPEDLSAYYPYRFDISILVLAGCAALLFALTAAAIMAGRRRPYVVFGWAWFLLTLLPAIGVVQAGGHGMADRATYVALLGLFVMLSWTAAALVDRRPRTRHILAAAGVVVVGLCAWTARGQAMHWSDSVSLWRHAIDVAPDNGRAHANLGAALAAKGRRGEAISHYREAARLTPDVAEVHNNLATALMETGHADEAVDHFREAIRLKPTYASAHNNAGGLMARRGRFAEALGHFSEAVRLEPAHTRARVNLAVTLMELGRSAEAVEHMREVLRTTPEDPQWNYITGMMLLSSGRRADAIPYFETTLRLDPSHQGARAAIASIR